MKPFRGYDPSHSAIRLHELMLNGSPYLVRVYSESIAQRMGLPRVTILSTRLSCPSTRGLAETLADELQAVLGGKQ